MGSQLRKAVQTNQPFYDRKKQVQVQDIGTNIKRTTGIKKLGTQIPNPKCLVIFELLLPFKLRINSRPMFSAMVCQMDNTAKSSELFWETDPSLASLRHKGTRQAGTTRQQSKQAEQRVKQQQIRWNKNNIKSRN